jgi:hypothetical protein
MSLFPKSGNDGTRCAFYSNVCLSKRGNCLSYRRYGQVSLHGTSRNEKKIIVGVLAVLDWKRTANDSSVIFIHIICFFFDSLLSLSFSSWFLSLVYKHEEGAASSQNSLAGRKGWFLFCVWNTHGLYTHINIGDTVCPQYFI